MKNPEDHKKLLAQIEELSRNSINYFDVEKEFFLIDSENLSNVRPRFYGYSIQRDGIYEEENLTPEAISNLDGRGCYIYIDVKDNEITIKQDLNGCWGIYLFRYGDYFVLSNSFFRLIDYVKLRYPLTVNRDYCQAMSVYNLFSISCTETAVNEIQIVNRSAILHIGRLNKSLEVEMLDYRERSIAPISQEGIAVLDRWIDFWSDIFSKLTQHTKFISADLSGGFDSRVAFVPLVYSGIDLNRIQIFSEEGDLYTHTEDHAIASKIAEHYGCKLNKPFPETQNLNYSLSDEFDINLYYHQLFSTLTSFGISKRIDKCYNFNGYGGEALRSHWQMTFKAFVQNYLQRVNDLSPAVASKLVRSFGNIFDSNSFMIRDKYRIEDENSVDIAQFLFYETYARYHFGRALVILYFSNVFGLSPAIDPDIRSLKIKSSECPDYNLTIAIILERYAPDLLKFPFNSGHSISPETIEYAKKVNERFPITRKNRTSMHNTNNFHLRPRDESVGKFLTSERNNPEIPKDLPMDYLKAIFDSSRTYGLFATQFDAELYHYAASYYENNAWGRERIMFSLVGVAKVIEDVEISQRNHPLNGYMRRFIEQDSAKIYKDEQINFKLLPHITARIDVQFSSTEGDFQITSMSDERAIVLKPDWCQKNDVKCVIIHSHSGRLEFVVNVTAAGNIKFVLRGVDKCNLDDQFKHLPYLIDYMKLIMNGETLLNTLVPVGSDEPYCCIDMNLEEEKELKLIVEWLPHIIDK